MKVLTMEDSELRGCHLILGELPPKQWDVGGNPTSRANNCYHSLVPLFDGKYKCLFCAQKFNQNFW